MLLNVGEERTHYKEPEEKSLGVTLLSILIEGGVFYAIACAIVYFI